MGNQRVILIYIPIFVAKKCNRVIDKMLSSIKKCYMRLWFGGGSIMEIQVQGEQKEHVKFLTVNEEFV